MRKGQTLLETVWRWAHCDRSALIGVFTLVVNNLTRACRIDANAGSEFRA